MTFISLQKNTLLFLFGLTPTMFLQSSYIFSVPFPIQRWKSFQLLCTPKSNLGKRAIFYFAQNRENRNQTKVYLALLLASTILLTWFIATGLLRTRCMLIYILGAMQTEAIEAECEAEERSLPPKNTYFPAQLFRPSMMEEHKPFSILDHQPHQQHPLWSHNNFQKEDFERREKTVNKTWTWENALIWNTHKGSSW